MEGEGADIAEGTEAVKATALMCDLHILVVGKLPG